MMVLDKEQIKEMLPHRDPILLVDSAEVDKESLSIATTLDVKAEMDIFKGHFPDDPVLPGVYITEAMAQCAALLLLCVKEEPGAKPYLVSVERIRFIRPVRPGDTLICHALQKACEGDYYEFSVSAEVNSHRAATGTLTLII